MNGIYLQGGRIGRREKGSACAGVEKRFMGAFENFS